MVFSDFTTTSTMYTRVTQNNKMFYMLLAKYQKQPIVW